MAAARIRLTMLCRPAERREERAEGVSDFMAKLTLEAASFEKALGEHQHEGGRGGIKDDGAGVEDAQHDVLQVLGQGNIGNPGQGGGIRVLNPAPEGNSEETQDKSKTKHRRDDLVLGQDGAENPE